MIFKMPAASHQNKANISKKKNNTYVSSRLFCNYIIYIYIYKSHLLNRIHIKYCTKSK